MAPFFSVESLVSGTAFFSLSSTGPGTVVDELNDGAADCSFNEICSLGIRRTVEFPFGESLQHHQLQHTNTFWAFERWIRFHLLLLVVGVRLECLSFGPEKIHVPLVTDNVDKALCAEISTAALALV